MTLRCLAQVRDEWQAKGLCLYDYQVGVAQKVLRLNGRAILADEVGLGKTIEAGLIIRELMVQKAIPKVLILTPASLVRQWCRELYEKFDLNFAPETDEWLLRDGVQICMSLDKAKRSPHREHLTCREWDLVVVDEAHRLKNAQSAAHLFVKQLRSTNLLLLSATPMQNDLHELYHLVSLVKPDLFGSFMRFQREFLIGKRICRNPQKLREILDQVMIRNKRDQIEVARQFPERKVYLFSVAQSPEEKELYQAVSDMLRKEYRNRLRHRSTILPLLTLQKEVCSSPSALSKSLRAMDLSWMEGGESDLHSLAEKIAQTGKDTMLLRLAANCGEKMVVFTEYRATQTHLAKLLRMKGFLVLEYHGTMSQDERDRALRKFASSGGILISTECGGQGLNLQHCRNVVNFDMPWNPMRVEQRIGRVHRIGQSEEVRVFNLFAAGTIEEYILRLLDEKINLFRQVIGELDMIIRHFEEKRSLESRIFEITMTSAGAGEMEERFDRLGEQIQEIRKELKRNLVLS